MNSGKYVFAQIMSFVSKYELQKCVEKYSGDYKTRWFNSRIHFWVMCFAQLANRESLRDIENSLIAMADKLYHCGIPKPASHSTIADANETRDWRIFADYAGILAAEARVLYKNDKDFQLEIENMVYAFDSTTIDLCLSLFPWAKFRKNKGAVKMHTLIDIRGSIPCFIHITDGLCHDVKALDFMPVEPGSIYLLDKGYVDYTRLYTLNCQQAYFVTRAKDNMAFEYPAHLRRVKFYDAELDFTFVFLSNNFEVSALCIAALYQKRWDVESFFRWIKQNLRIKIFYGTSFNAVCLQIWIAVCVYLLLSIIKAQLNMKQTLYTILQTLSLCLFEKTPINQIFENKNYIIEQTHDPNQLDLFDL